jgi:AAA ATPase domain
MAHCDPDPGADTLVGRRAERAALEEAFDAAAAGRCPVLFVGGEAGVGKSVLVDVVLTARGTRRVSVAADDRGAPAMDLLVRLVDGLGGARALTGRDGLDGTRVAAAVGAALTAHAGHEPLAVVLDDVQWSDEGSLAQLPVLARTLAPLSSW